MRTLIPAFLAVVMLAGCATNDPYSPADRRGRDGRADDGSAREASASITSLLPGGSWWFDTRYAEKLGLNADQKARLDALSNERQPALDQSRREAMAAEADFRAQLNRDGVAPADIEAVSARVRDARAALTGRELHYVADVRLILTHDQWWTLQSEMQSMRQERTQERRGGGRGNYPGGRRGGRGGYPGGGGSGPFG
jgi:Spy/CpxP family protein refolding chaperone